MARRQDVKDTNFPGIKQRISDGKYIVSIDMGRQKKWDNKTKQYRLRQIKSTRVVSTLKEAKSLVGKNNSDKEFKRKTGVTQKVPFDACSQQYLDAHKDIWTVTYMVRNEVMHRRCVAYFGSTDVRKIDTLDIEEFFNACKNGEMVGYERLTNNSVIKIKTYLNGLYKWMKKAPNRYGVSINPVTDADPGKKEMFKAKSLTEEEAKAVLKYVINNEDDTAIMVLFALPILAGLRRGEVSALQWQDIDWDTDRIHIVRQRIDVAGQSLIKVPKNGSDNGKTPEERRERWTAMPKLLKDILTVAKAQQVIFLGRDLKADDWVYRPKVNCVNDNSPNAKKLDRRFCDVKKAIVRDIGLDISELRLHDLRHTFISLCLNNGVSTLRVASSAGHSFNNDSLTTVKVYYHDDGNRTENINCLNKIFDIDIDIDTMISQLEKPRIRISKRPNPRSDEY